MTKGILRDVSGEIDRFELKHYNEEKIYSSIWMFIYK